MKGMITLFFAGMLLIAGNAQAHCGKCGVGDAPKADKGDMIQEKTDKLAHELSLSDEQKVKVPAIITDKMAKKQQIMDEKHKAMDALHEEFQTKLKDVLNKEQMGKWEAMKQNKEGMEGKCPM